jgi:hypothetical protein
MKKANSYDLYLAGLSEDYELNENAPPDAPNQNQASDAFAKIKDQLLAAVDDWAKMIMRLLQKPSQGKPMGLWDRFKGGVQNLWYGRDNAQNPNYWRNRYGDDLGGAKESFIHSLTLRQYHELRMVADSLERDILVLNEAEGFDNLKITQMVKQAADQLKKNITRIIDSRGANPSQPSPKPGGGPGKPPGNPPLKAGAEAVPEGGASSGGENDPSPGGGGPGKPPGNPPLRAGAVPPTSQEDGGSGGGGSGGPSGGGPGGSNPDGRAGMVKNLKMFKQAGVPIDDEEEWADLIIKGGMKDFGELSQRLNKIYEVFKSKMERLKKSPLEAERLYALILSWVGRKLEHGEADQMDDMISDWLVGYSLVSDNGQNNEKAAQYKDFMDLVNYAKKALSGV